MATVATAATAATAAMAAMAAPLVKSSVHSQRTPWGLPCPLEAEEAAAVVEDVEGAAGVGWWYPRLLRQVQPLVPCVMPVRAPATKLIGLPHHSHLLPTTSAVARAKMMMPRAPVLRPGIRGAPE